MAKQPQFNDAGASALGADNTDNSDTEGTIDDLSSASDDNNSPRSTRAEFGDYNNTVGQPEPLQQPAPACPTRLRSSSSSARYRCVNHDPFHDPPPVPNHSSAGRRTEVEPVDGAITPPSAAISARGRGWAPISPPPLRRLRRHGGHAGLEDGNDVEGVSSSSALELDKEVDPDVEGDARVADSTASPSLKRPASPPKVTTN